ncbi:MAG: alpha/beta fold hydrolase BchO [Pseudomonadota bacterium]
MDWETAKANWPHAAKSRFIESRPHVWHVQEMGKGPTLLLLHGAGGATHSWRDLMPILAKDFHVIAIDLPGHGFTNIGRKQRCGIEPMSEDIIALAKQEAWEIDAIIGHSAGAALGFRMLQLGCSPRGTIIGLNAALGNFPGLAGVIFPMMAKMLTFNPLTANIVSSATTPQSVKRLIEGTGSSVNEAGLAMYHQLVSARSHVDGALTMMSQWKLDGVLARLPETINKSLLIVGENDRAVPPITSESAAAKLPNAKVMRLPELGHLAHEEAPETFAPLITRFLTA